MVQPNRLSRQTLLRVRAPRVPIDLEVESKTIGTTASYCFYTEDISRSGLLLVWDREARLPFIVNTLVELTIDPKGTCLDRPVNCLGKVVRRESNSPDAQSNQARLGVQIVQIDHSDLHAWEGCLAQLEQRFGIELAQRGTAVPS